MAEVKRDGEDITIRLKADELEELTWVLEKAGNSSCRERNRYETGSVMYDLRLKCAEIAWHWSENLSIHRPKIPHVFSVKSKEF